MFDRHWNVSIAQKEMQLLANNERKKDFYLDVRGGKGWVGGLYYRRNVLYSLMQNTEFTNAFRVRALCTQDSLHLLDDFAGIDRVRIDGKMQKAVRYAALVVQHAFFYPAYPGRLTESARHLQPVYWIPDFQEEHYPGFFETGEIEARRANNRKIAEGASMLVLSSEACLDDFEKYYAGHRCDTCVLHFVSYIEREVKTLTPEFEREVLRRYGLNPEVPYFCVSNQFWQHKNHLVVLDAMKILEDRGIRPRFVFTGEPRDYRFPAYIDEVKAKMAPFVEAGQLTQTGFIERSEQLALLKNARAVVQPSLFEGWGTVLEDCKVLDKDVILSDIPVHREQANERCVLFDPHNAGDLADKIETELSHVAVSDVESGIIGAAKRAAVYSEPFVQKLIERSDMA